MGTKYVLATLMIILSILAMLSAKDNCCSVALEKCLQWQAGECQAMYTQYDTCDDVKLTCVKRSDEPLFCWDDNETQG